MRVLQIIRPGEAEWGEAPVPQPGLGEVLVKVLGVTTCPHWDIHLMDGEPMFPGSELAYPLTAGQPGHEMVGEVIEIGRGLGDFAGKVWRIGLKGESSKTEHVYALRAALEEILPGVGFEVPRGAGVAAASIALAGT